MSNIIKLDEGTKKIRTFEQCHFDQLSDQIHLLSSLMGLKTIEPDEAMFLINFVKSEFSDFSFSEIQEALKMNLSGKLEKKVEPYGSFNINYLSSILVLYRKERQKARARKKAERIELTDEQKKEKELKLMEEIFKELNDRFTAGVTKFTYEQGKKYFDCLKYFNLMPNYKDAERWEEAKKQYLDRIKNNPDKESLLILKESNYLNLPESLKNRLKIGAEGIYKGLLVERFVIETKDFYEDLNEMRNN